MTRRALVLGGGGLTGIAWETGVLAGLASAGAAVTGADLIVGTSAGSLVGAWVAGGTPATELYERLVAAPLPGEDLAAGATLAQMIELFVSQAKTAGTGKRWRRRIGERALAAETPPERARRDVFAARLASHEWPESDLAIVAVNARTGEPRVFRRGEEAGLVDAVTASCALPLLWPPATIGSSRYVDGGLRSVTNADLASGHDRVLVLAPVTDDPLRKQVSALRRTAEVHVIELDAAQAAIGADLRDPSTRVPAAETGHAQGVAEAASVAALWRES